jgi:type IV secretion system protein VirB6
VALALTGALTLFVAMFGYRMLLGQGPNARDALVAVAKIGLVLALATSWPAFRTLAYDVAFRGPAQLASAIGAPAGLPGAEGGLVARLQGVDDMINELTVIGTGRPPQTDILVTPTGALTPAQQQQELQRLQGMQDRPRWDPVQDAKRVAQGRTLFLTGAIAALASVRLIAGLLLALGPLFALFLLFDHTRGLFEGWVRGLAGAALGALGTAIVLAVQLALMESWLANVVSLRRANIPTPSVPVELLVMTLVFVLVLLGVLVAAAKVARGFRMPENWRIAPGRWVESLVAAQGAGRSQMLVQGAGGREPADERTRAIGLANAVQAAQRREMGSPPPPGANLGAQTVAEAMRRDGNAAAASASAMPIDQGLRRRTRGRVSAGARRRDRTA